MAPVRMVKLSFLEAWAKQVRATPGGKRGPRKIRCNSRLFARDRLSVSGAFVHVVNKRSLRTAVIVRVWRGVA